MAVVTVGIDLDKNIFAVHGVDKNGNAVLVKPKSPGLHILAQGEHPFWRNVNAISGFA